MLWWKNNFLIEVTIASNYIFVTMSSFYVFMLFFHAKKAIAQLQHIHLFWQPLDNMYPLKLLDLDISYDYIFSINKKLRGINPMVLSAPWAVSYSDNIFEPPNSHYQTFSSKNIFPFYYTLVPFKQTLITINL